MKKIERTVVLPLFDNNGNSIENEVENILKDILNIAGGYSAMRQEGAWQDENGKIYKDISCRVVTVVDELQDMQISCNLPRWCAVLRQECLYTHISVVDAVFILPEYPAGEDTPTRVPDTVPVEIGGENG